QFPSGTASAHQPRPGHLRVVGEFAWRPWPHRRFPRSAQRGYGGTVASIPLRPPLTPTLSATPRKTPRLMCLFQKQHLTVISRINVPESSVGFGSGEAESPQEVLA